MTEQEFLALPPRQQDAFIAENVRGWRINWVQPTRGADIGVQPRPWAKYRTRGWCKCPEYTFFMRDAWTLIAAFKEERALYIEIRSYPDGFKAIVRKVDGTAVVAATHARPQYAICLACLRAVGAIQ